MTQDKSRVMDFEGPDAFEEDYESQSHIFHKLMHFKVKRILLVSSLYDAFIIEEEGLIPELVIGEYSHLDLSSPPHVFRVSSGMKALEKLGSMNYDLVITMSKNIGMDPFDFGEQVKKIKTDLPVVLLATDTSDLFDAGVHGDSKGIDKVFYWNGDSNLFIAIIKFIEDQVNAKHDTVQGNVQVIIMVEDSVRFYSMFLPFIYSELVQQTQKLISEDLNEMQRRLRMRIRPKILMAETYEEGLDLFNTYHNNVLGIISDVNFKRNGVMDEDAGYSLLQEIRKNDGYIPILLQSTKSENMKRVKQMGAYFLHKNSPQLLKDFRHFLLSHLGFGDFIFLLPTIGTGDATGGEESNEVKANKTVLTRKTKDWLHDSTIELGRASDLREFERLIQNVPPASIRFHGDRNNFSNWLMARGEFKLARKLRPRKATEFRGPDAARDYLVRVFRENRKEKHYGIITDFKQQTFEFESSFSRLGGGSLGGKGRGIAFIRSILSVYNIQKRYRELTIMIPNTVVIATDEFDRFIHRNNLGSMEDLEQLSDREIAQRFIDGVFSVDFENEMRRLLQNFRSPVAVRSSSLLEDSQNYPFAGIYSTYMLPNNHEDDEVRVRQLGRAIKLVYASMFFRNARIYIKSTASKVEEEKMAVAIQEIVGKDYDGRFYPNFSGVAQSYNFYPVSHQSYEDGIVSLAVGLGKAVVGGEKVMRFSPKFPTLIPEFSTPAMIFNNSQQKLYVLDTSRKEFDLTEDEETTLKRLDVVDIEKDGTLDTLGSTFERNSGMIRDSMDFDGPHLVTFAGILKYDTLPLAPLLNDLLKLGERSMGCPVEIEFAVILPNAERKKAVFAILQIRPIVISHEHCDISLDLENSKEREAVLIHSDRALGNGLIQGIRDVVYVPHSTFDASQTVNIAREIGEINNELESSDRPFLLIGPGRWGTEDRWLGIPVAWGDISGAKVIVETAMDNFNIDPSQGTHFFQNMTSRKIGYISIPLRSEDNYLDWDWLDGKESIKETKYVRHVSLEDPLVVKLDGRCGGALILKR